MLNPNHWFFSNCFINYFQWPKEVSGHQLSVRVSALQLSVRGCIHVHFHQHQSVSTVINLDNHWSRHYQVEGQDDPSFRWLSVCHQSGQPAGDHQMTPALIFSDCPLSSVCHQSGQSQWLDITRWPQPSFSWLFTSISVSSVWTMAGHHQMTPAFSDCPLPLVSMLSIWTTSWTSWDDPSCQFQWLSMSISISGQDITSRPQLSISVTVHVHQHDTCHQSGQDITSRPQLSISVAVHVHQRVNCHQTGQDITSLLPGWWSEFNFHVTGRFVHTPHTARQHLWYLWLLLLSVRRVRSDIGRHSYSCSCYYSCCYCYPYQFDHWLIDDCLYSAIFRSLEQTHCAHMWFYVSD